MPPQAATDHEPCGCDSPPGGTFARELIPRGQSAYPLRQRPPAQLRTIRTLGFDSMTDAFRCNLQRERQLDNPGTRSETSDNLPNATRCNDNRTSISSLHLRGATFLLARVCAPSIAETLRG
ncbi:unnamed protein product [Lampetra fluviatilis]